MTTSLQGKSFIGYSRSTSTTAWCHGLDATTGESLEPAYSRASDEEIERAVKLAESAFATYSDLPGKTRGAFLRAIADGIEAALPAIVERAPRETGLPEARIRGETARTTGQLRLFAALAEEGSWVDARIDRAQPDRQPLPKPDLRCMFRPLGPVAVYCPSNFPLAFSVAGGDTASALAAGCPVVVIGHHSHPGVAEIVGDAVNEAARKTGMPEGVFSLLFGGGRQVGLSVVRHPAIHAVGFTGSRAGGTALMEAAAQRPRPIPVYAEMSSVNPVVFLPGALEGDKAGALAEGFFGSLTLGVGQFCTNPGLVFLPETGGDAFLERLQALVEDAAPGVMLNASIACTYADAAEALAGQSGVKVVARAKKAAKKNQGAPLVLEVSAADFAANPALQGEMFGPACLLVRGSPEAIEAAIATLEGQLTASIHGTEEEIASRPGLVTALKERTGRLIFNGFPTGVEVCASIVHGGPYPATSDGRSTSVGTLAIYRFCRPVAWQNAPQSILPPELQDANPLGIKQSIV